MNNLISFFIRYWMPFAIIMSVFWGVRGLHMSLIKNWKDQTSKLGYFFWLSYQLIFNFVGSFAGWICFYVLLVRAQSKLPDLSGFHLSDFILFLLSLLGLTGHLPQTLYGLVVSIGKFAEAGTARVLGQKVPVPPSESKTTTDT